MDRLDRCIDKRIDRGIDRWIDRLDQIRLDSHIDRQIQSTGHHTSFIIYNTYAIQNTYFSCIQCSCNNIYIYIDIHIYVQYTYAHANRRTHTHTQHTCSHSDSARNFRALLATSTLPAHFPSLGLNRKDFMTSREDAAMEYATKMNQPQMQL